MIFERTLGLIGSNNLQKLSDSNIIIFGVGGVGGYVTEMLVRSGIGRITIVDFDRVSDSNINRQIIALNSTVGKFKVDVMRDRIRDINPDCIVTTHNERVSKDTVDRLLQGDYDYVVDAIDSIDDKCELICRAKAMGLNIISALGAGNRFRRPEFQVTDIYKTHTDGLAKKLRKQLKDKGVENLKVVYTCEVPEKREKVTSIVYYPAMCGCLISSEVISDLLHIDN